MPYEHTVTLKPNAPIVKIDFVMPDPDNWERRQLFLAMLWQMDGCPVTRNQLTTRR